MTLVDIGLIGIVVIIVLTFIIGWIYDDER